MTAAYDRVYKENSKAPKLSSARLSCGNQMRNDYRVESFFKKMGHFVATEEISLEL